ncbi:Uncharacterised protein [Vibrio cholerae]|nr:Uncharacterised protein [Vibrio cholerae]
MRFYSPSNPSTIASLLATHDSYFALYRYDRDFNG